MSEFLEGVDVRHDGRFHITTNLWRIRGGKRLFLETVEKYGYDLPKWKETFNYVGDNGYRPRSCQKCVYSEICRNRGTLLATIREEADHRVEITRERKYVSREEAERRLAVNISRAVRTKVPGIHLIRAQTALGKTEACCRVIGENREKRFILALPTIRLREEVYVRLAGMGIRALMTSSVEDPGFPQEVSRRVHACYDMGLSCTARIIRNYLKEHEGEENTEVLMCRKYLENSRELEDARVILTTHSRLLTMKKEFLDRFTVLIDEDILQMHMFNQVSGVTVSALKRLREESCIEILKDRARTILEAPEDTYCSMIPLSQSSGCFFMNEEKAAGNPEPESGNVGGLLRAASFVKHPNGTVNYFSPSLLPQGKYIILSATLNETIYRLYFKNTDIIGYDQPPAEYTGRLEQYTYHSLGRTDLEEKYEKILEFIRTLDGEWEIITFKKYVEDTNGLGLYFGNLAGCDGLRGKNLAIIGTPYTIDDRYKLVAHYLGVDANRTEDFRPHRQRIEYNGYRFLHTTYKNELLRKLQAYRISSELEQAVGRARLLREACRVLLFSSFPCEQARIHEEDYLQDGKDAVQDRERTREAER